MSGHGFGELALMHRTKKYKRAATITCKTLTHVAVLSKEDFQRVYLTQIERSYDKMIDFLLTFRICHDIPRATLT
jgi:CRP-like cAMP-binding protein